MRCARSGGPDRDLLELRSDVGPMKQTLAVLTAAGILAAMPLVRADILEQVLVKVNGEIITKTELEQRQIAAVRQKQPNLRPDDDAELKKVLAKVTDRKSTRLNSSHIQKSRMPSSA